MSDTFELVFEGPIDDSPETLRKLRGALVGDLEFSVEEAQAALQSLPYSLSTSDNEAELAPLLKALADAGGKVCIISKQNSNSNDEDSLILSDVWDEKEIDPTANLVQAVSELPDALSLDLDKDKPVEAKVPEKEETEELTLDFSFDDGSTEEEASEPEKVAEEPLAAKEPEPESEELDFNFEFDGNETSPEPEAPQASVSAEPEPPTIETSGLSLDEPEEVSEPEVAAPEVAAKEEAAGEEEEEAPRKKAKEGPLSKEEEEAEDSEITQALDEGMKLGDLAKKRQQADTEEDEFDESDYVEVTAGEEDEEYASVEAGPAHQVSSPKKTSEIAKFCLMLLLFLVFGNIIYFTFLASAPEKPNLDIAGALSQANRAPKPEPVTEPAPIEVEPVVKDFKTQVNTDQMTGDLEFSFMDEKLVSSTISLSTPKPPEPTREEIVAGVMSLPWIRKVEVDRVEYELGENGIYTGSGRAKAYVIQDYTSNRVVGHAVVIGKLEGESFSGKLFIQNTETETEQIADGITLNRGEGLNYQLEIGVEFSAPAFVEPEVEEFSVESAASSTETQVPEEALSTENAIQEAPTTE